MGGNKKILVVDDSNITARQLEAIVAELGGYEVVGRAADGASAIKLFRQLAPDVVCMDIVMPVMDGIKATQAILQLDPSAKIVVISSVGGARDMVVAALKAGARNVIAKPFEAEAIRQTLDAL